MTFHPNLYGTYPDLVDYYGCCKCQQFHYGPEAIYQQHIGFQDKHGVRQISPAIYARVMLQRRDEAEK